MKSGRIYWAWIVVFAMCLSLTGANSIAADNESTDEMLKKLVKVIIEKEETQAARESKLSEDMLKLQQQNLVLLEKIRALENSKNDVEEQREVVQVVSEVDDSEKKIVDLQKQNIELLKMIYARDEEKKEQDRLVAAKLAEIEAERTTVKETVIVERPVEVIKYVETYPRVITYPRRRRYNAAAPWLRLGAQVLFNVNNALEHKRKRDKRCW